ncbi:MFS transporter [Trebonia sp.]|uniref:MFS transporter n=1 Tax=Trebonia sp. TaxID=2767075 RepID=UPI003BB08A80
MADADGPVSEARTMWLGVVSLCLVQFIDVLGVTVMVTALPAMLSDLRASPDAASLISTGYAMFFGGLLMFGARLGDRFGHRRIIFTGLAIFAVAAVAGATASSVVVLTAARCLQGAAAAMSVPSALRLLTTITADGPQRERAIAGWSASGAAAGASGFVVGGVVTYLVGWRAVFWVYVAVAVLLAVAIRRSVPRDQRADASVRLSVPSVIAFTTAVMAFVVATTLLPQPGRAALGGALLAVAVVLAGVFIIVDRRSAAPLLPRAVLGMRPLRQGAAGGLLNTLTTSSAITLATLYLQNTLGHSPLVAGLMLLPFSVAVIAGSALAAPALVRWAPQRLVSTGLAVIAVCDAALIPAASSTWALPVCVAAGGAGIGLSSVATTRLGTSVPIAVRGTASGIINTAAQLGTAVGIAALLLLATLTTGIPEPGSSAPAIAWGTAALIACTGAVIFGLKSPGHATSFRPTAADSEARTAGKGSPNASP